MEAIATSFLGLAVSADREQNRELSGDRAPELEALGLNAPNDHEDKLAFADELQQALAGVLLATAPQTNLAVPPAPAVGELSPVAATVTDVPASAAPPDVAVSAIPTPFALETSSPAPVDRSTAKPEMAVVDDKSPAPVELSKDGIPAEIGLEKTLPTFDKTQTVQEHSASSLSQITDSQAQKLRRPAAEPILPRDSSVPITDASKAQLSEKVFTPIHLRASTMPQDITLAAKPISSAMASFAQLDARWLATKGGQERIINNDKVEISHGAIGPSLPHSAVGTAEPTFHHAVASPALVEQIAKSILTKADFARSGGTADFQLRLDPPDLGPVRVVLTSTDDTVHLRLFVHEAAARQQLETQMDSLRQRLEDAGVSLGRFDVLQDRGSSGNWQSPGWLHGESPPPMIPAGRQTAYQAPRVTPTRIGLVDVMA